MSTRHKNASFAVADILTRSCVCGVCFSTHVFASVKRFAEDSLRSTSGT